MVGVLEDTPLGNMPEEPSGTHPARPLEPGDFHGSRVKPTDDELGDQLLAKWSEERVFMYGAWHRYEGGVWKPENRAAMQFWDILIENKPRGIKPNAGKAASVEKYCQLKKLVDEKELSQDVEYINLQNGLYSLQTDTLEPHRADLYFTSQLPFAYDPAAVCPAWEQFLAQVLVDEKGLPDSDLIMLLQEAFYYSLTSDTSYRVSFWCVGASGTGKSTLVNVLLQLAGDAAMTIDLDSLKDNQYQVADIAGKRVVSFSEPDSRQPLADGWYKKLVSKDPIPARQIHGKPFNFIPICKLWGSMNDTPRVVDRSDAVYGRVIIIPMNKVVSAKDRDGRLDEKLRGELAGIFNWALKGGARLKKRGRFTVAEQSEAARDAYRQENDTESLYLSERCTRGDNYTVSADDLFQDYKAWCLDNGYGLKPKVRVGKEWKRLGLIPERERVDGKQSRIWHGVALTHTIKRF